MSTAQLVGAGGAALVLTNFWLGPNRDTITGGALTSSADEAHRAAAHRSLRTLAGELLFVAVLTLAAGADDTAGKAALAILAALWIVYLMLRFSPNTAAKKPTK